jgi:hypothetical protein
VLRVDLSFIGDGIDDACDGDGTVVEKAGGHGLLAHEVREDTGVRCKAGKRYSEMSVNADDFLLVGTELFGIALQQRQQPTSTQSVGPVGYLEGYKDAVGLGYQPYGSGTLLDCFKGIFHLEDAALGGAMGRWSASGQRRERGKRGRTR